MLQSRIRVADAGDEPKAVAGMSVSEREATADRLKRISKNRP
jgi:hypothetical protein